MVSQVYRALDFLKDSTPGVPVTLSPEKVLELVSLLPPDVRLLAPPSTEYLPCPFCGDRDIRFIEDTGITITRIGWRVECGSCPCEMTWFHDRPTALKYWNTRAINARRCPEPNCEQPPDGPHECHCRDHK